MKIVIDDDESIAKELARLYKNLPEDIRSNEPVIPASRLLFEIGEYICFLTETLQLRKSKPAVADAFGRICGTARLTTRTRGTQSLNLSSSLIKPRAVPGPTNFLGDNRGPASSVVVKNKLPEIPAYTGSPYVSAKPPGSAPNILTKKPMTILAKDPLTGLQNPVTLTISPLSGLRTTDGKKPGTVRILNPAAAPSNPDVYVLKNAALKKSTPLISSTDSSVHGLICKEGCTCAIMNGSTLGESLKKRIWDYLLNCMKILPKDSETVLTYSWIQEELMSTLFTNLSRVAFFQLCRIVSPSFGNYYSGERRECLLIKRRSRNLVEGKIDINGRGIYCVPLILVKLFREGYDSQSLSSLKLESLPDCDMTKDPLIRKHYLCINPFHYGYESAADLSRHTCRNYVRLQAFGSKLSAICHNCKEPVFENITSTGFFTINNGGLRTSIIDKPKESAESPPLPSLNTEIQVKEEPVEVEENDNMTIEELDKDFESMMESIEEQVKVEAEGHPREEETGEADEEESDCEPPLKIVEEESTPADGETPRDAEEVAPDKCSGGFEPGKRKRPFVELQVNPAKRRRFSCRSPPGGRRLQCWQCLAWFSRRENLAKHSCLAELNKTGLMFTCHFCGCCADSVDKIRDHVKRCKRFNLRPLTCFTGYESAMTSVHVAGESQNGPKRSTPSRSASRSNPAKCDQCNVVLASKQELISHQSKNRCKHVECETCSKIFANVRSLDNHKCDEGDASDAVRDNVDQDIVVSKLDRKKLSHQPVRCKGCGNQLHSYNLLRDHQLIPNSCGTCAQEFESTCDLLGHTCPDPDPASRDSDHRVDENDVDQAPVTFKIKLETIDDTTVPSIVDGDVEDAPLASRKKPK